MNRHGRHFLHLNSLAFALVMMTQLVACKPYRVEYHKRPDFYARASTGPLPEQVTLEDGTVINYKSNFEASSFGQSKGGDGAKPYEIREDLPDGKVVLHAALPEHVLLNALQCVRDEEYQLLFDQLLAQQTKKEYEKAGKGFDDVAAFFKKNRHEIVATLTRMIAGLPHEEVAMKNVESGVTRCALRPQIAEPYVFKSVWVIKEDRDLKLLMIR